MCNLGSAVSSVVGDNDENMVKKLKYLIDATNQFNSNNAAFAQSSRRFGSIKQVVKKVLLLTNPTFYDRLQRRLEKSSKEGSPTSQDLGCRMGHPLNVL